MCIDDNNKFDPDYFPEDDVDVSDLLQNIDIDDEDDLTGLFDND